MYALTLHRPWEEPILAGVKPVENRSWRPPEALLGKAFLIHAGKTYDERGAAFCRMNGFELFPREDSDELSGAIVGIARLACVIEEKRIVDPPPFALDEGTRRLGEASMASPWFFGPYGWVLSKVKRLSLSYPCAGHQKLWRVPDHIFRGVEKELQGGGADGGGVP